MISRIRSHQQSCPPAGNGFHRSKEMHLCDTEFWCEQGHFNRDQADNRLWNWHSPTHSQWNVCYNRHPNPKKNQLDWYGICKAVSEVIDDYFDDNGKTRSGIRPHIGTGSASCTTVPLDAENSLKWLQLQKILKSTTTVKIPFKQGPHFWNSTGTITSFGTLEVK
jgi:hypothetical protein